MAVRIWFRNPNGLFEMLPIWLARLACLRKDIMGVEKIGWWRFPIRVFFAMLVLTFTLRDRSRTHKVARVMLRITALQTVH